MSNLAKQIKEITGENVYLCYQCEKCSSGCPVSVEMDLVPTQIMHSCQLNLKDKIFDANTIWLCASCETCTTRCPQGIDIARVMDGLRIISRREKIKAKIPSVPLFYNLSLLSIRFVGSIFEGPVAGFMRLCSGTILKDMPLAMEMLKKGKLKIFPNFRNIFKINSVFRKVKKYEEF
ncbi:MAG: 4Fe-4S dicluster domain-containing protein [Candidatus Hydrogenedentota bacterium]